MVSRKTHFILIFILLLNFPVFTSLALPLIGSSPAAPDADSSARLRLSDLSIDELEHDSIIIPDAPWFDTHWNYRKAHIIQGSSHGELTDYQLRFEIHRGIGTDTGSIVYCGFNCTLTFQDLRFTEADGVTLCSYWIEELITSPERIAYVWVKIPTIPVFPSNMLIFLYYGYNHALSVSDIDATFDVACDMEEGNLNDWDGSWGTATHSTSALYPHTGSYSLEMIPLSGLPDTSGRYIDVSGFDNYHAYRVWFYDTGSSTIDRVTNAVLSDGPTDDYKVYMGCNGQDTHYSYWDGGSWVESSITRSTGFHYYEFRHLNTTTYLYLDSQLLHTSTRLDEPTLDEFWVYVYRGYPEASYFDDLIVRKWVSLEPTHIGWNTTEIPPFRWDVSPSNQVVYFNHQFVYDLDAVPEGWVDTWEINDTINFAIDSQGTITNNSALMLGTYGINVRVNSTYGDLLEAMFQVVVIEEPILFEWTVLVYLDGDNDLEEYAFDDFNTMETIGSTADIRILVYVDFWTGSHTPFTGARCYEITQDNNPSLIVSTQLPAGLPSEPNMGQWQTLRDFIVFGQAYAPADHYLLTLWNHGAGAYGLCVDDTSSDRLTISELKQALNDPLVQHLDIVAFDACLMGQLEVAYEIRDATDIVVFSEESVPLTGFPYEDILLNLTTFPNSGPKTVATSMVYYYVTAYDFGGRYYDPLYNDICLSAIETSKLSSVALNLDQLVDSLAGSTSTPLTYEMLSWARSTTQGFTWADFMDLNSFASSITSYFSSASPVYQLAVNLSNSIQACVFEEMHLSGLTDASGLGAVFASYEPYQLALATDTDWDEFMEAFIDVGSSPINALELVPNLGIQIVSTLHCGYLDGSYDSVFFKFTPGETGRYFITLEAAWDKYDTDFDLYIYDVDENLLESSISTDSSESISISLNAGATYYIEVYSYPGAYDGIGVFYLNVNPPSVTGPLPLELMILLMAGATIVVTIGVVALVIFLQRRSRMPAPTPHYTSSTYALPRQVEPAGSPKFCAYCGATIPKGARYCPICGASTSYD